MKRIYFNDPMDVCDYAQSYIDNHNITNEDLAQDLYVYAINVFWENGPEMSRNFFQNFASKYRSLVQKYEKEELNRPERLIDHKNDSVTDFIDEICEADFHNLINAAMNRALTQKEIQMLRMYYDEI